MADYSNLTVGFIGAGKMATAMATGFFNAGLFKPSRMFASCPSEWDSSELQNMGVQVFEANLDVTERSDVIILAVKPDTVAPVLREVSQSLSKKQPLIISIAAGITIAALEKAHSGRYVRVMPNTPAVNPGYGASVFCPDFKCSPDDAKLVERMFSCLGFCSPIPEYLMDAVTGLSGSGPAYVFTVIEALSDGGVKMGLPRDLSTKLAAQTVLGAAKMVVESGQHPAVLRDNVASAGGTTIHGLHALEQGGIRNALITAVEAATKRSIEMGQSSQKK
ncbi:uncharacterized protein LOC129586299 [Paramacrobiotus metropolitanus]|uniref:uncharacterized protein LOC129586299 n=1 Tax=Paramacrobiotus metropolitanus TaxID=2943436 RepID=UPI0024458AA9|nr:uncharacterized protein LOC129586299 [Paramacrobiotus metropolitanus]